MRVIAALRTASAPRISTALDTVRICPAVLAKGRRIHDLQQLGGQRDVSQNHLRELLCAVSLQKRRRD